MKLLPRQSLSRSFLGSVGAKSVAATKSDPKVLQDNKARQDALKQQSKQSSGQ